MNVVEVTDIHGKKHKVDLDDLDAKPFAKDGDKAHFTMMAMDTANNLFICDADQLKEHNMSNDKYQVTDEVQKRVEDAYQKMCRDLENAWRGKDYKPSGTPGESPMTAYDEARRDLEIAWRNGR